MIKKFILYLTLLLFNLIQSIEIIIQFNSTLSEIPKNLTPIDFISSLVNNEIHTNINLGTPSQNLDFLIDFNFYHTYIIKDNNNKKNYKRFNYNSSSTFNYLGKKEYFSGSDFFYAINSSDIANINKNFTNFNYTFLHVVDITQSLPIKYPGIIGFGVVPNVNPFLFEAGLIYQLKNKNITNNYIYSLVYNKNDFNGKIIIEKNIYENYSIDNLMKDYCIITLDYNYFWGWNYINSFLDFEELGINILYFKPELGVIIVNIKIMDILKNKFFDEKIKEGKCFQDFKQYSFFYCEKNVKIDVGKFIFQRKNKDIEFIIDSNDLIFEYNNKIFFLMVFNVHLSNEAYLGYPFFKKFDVIFNQGDRNVGFYKIIKNEEDTNDKDNKTDEKGNYNKKKILIKILFPIFIVLFILIVLYFIFYIFRKSKKISNERLSDSLNYQIND